MTRIYNIKNPPLSVKRYFENRFKNTVNDIFTFNYYWYWGGISSNDTTKIYACRVFKNNTLWDYSVQHDLDWFIKQDLEVVLCNINY